jgi:alpha-beta hydrolase superfamily lysophospholipase
MMKPIAHVTVGLLLVVLGSGCEGAKIVTAGTTDKLAMDLAGTGEQLLRRGQIDLCRRFPMADGTAIDVWTVRAETNTGGAVVVLHGDGQSKANYLGMGRELARKGYDVVLIDLRCHGRSGGKYITCGAREKRDVQAVVDALAAEKNITPEPLYVFGVNFGGATAIQYAAIEPKVRGVVAVAPWKDTVSKARRDLGLLISDEQFAVKLDEAGKLADFDPKATSAVLDAATLTCPVYLIHGLLDAVVPVADSQAIYDALTGPRKLKIILPGSPEYLVMIASLDAWYAEQVDLLAKGELEMDEPKKE